MIINMIGGGLGGKIKAITVSGESELPSTADGTIAIVSSTPAGTVYVQGTEPESPATGDVWVLVDSSGDNIITIGNVQVYPAQARQYVDGAWVDVTAYLRMDGAWAVLAYPSIYLYNRGDQCTDVTGGWAGNKWYGGTYTFNADNIYLTVANGGNQPSAIQTKNPVDVTNYKTLKFIGSTSDTLVKNITFGLLESSLLGSIDDSMERGFAVYGQKDPLTGDFILTVDVSECNGTYYVGLFTRKTNTYLYEILLEG